MTFLSTAVDGFDPSVYRLFDFIWFFFSLRNDPPYACMPILLVSFVLFCLSVVFGLTTLVEKKGNHCSGAFLMMHFL